MTCSLLRHHTVPIIAVENNLICVEFSIETTAYLRLSVAVKTKYRKVPKRVITRILVYVMNLYWFAADPTYTTSAIRKEQCPRRYI
jgi:hypothetical protein